MFFDTADVSAGFVDEAVIVSHLLCLVDFVSSFLKNHDRDHGPRFVRFALHLILSIGLPGHKNSFMKWPTL